MLLHLLQVAVTCALLLALMLGWIAVQSAARRVAEAHPEAGPLRLIGGGCGGHGHGHEARPTPGTDAARVIRIAPAQAAPAVEGSCASCDNTACKSPDKALLATR